MNRRAFLSVVTGTLLTASLAAEAQRKGRSRRLGIIMAVGKIPEYVAALAAFEEALGALGWKLGDNLQMDDRWSAGGPERARSAAQEIVALNPDVILGQSTAVAKALRSPTRTIPIVFVHVPDPIVSGFASNIARPGGVVGEVHDLEGIEAVMTGLAAEPRGDVAVTPDAFFAGHSTRIVSLLERFRLPAAYPYRYYVAQGGRLCYGVNNVDLFRQAALYVDRILRAAKPADLPIQQPTRLDLVINLKSAKALGLTVSPSLFARADQVIA
jgi:putative ABC transport system substrate-binding protein